MNVFENKVDMKTLDHTLKYGFATTLVEADDFFRARDFLNNETSKNGYGIIVSNPIFMFRYVCGGPTKETTSEDQHCYIISNLVKSYYGEDELIPFGEYEDYNEQFIIYDRADIPFFEENFRNIYKALKNN